MSAPTMRRPAWEQRAELVELTNDMTGPQRAYLLGAVLDSVPLRVLGAAVAAARAYHLPECQIRHDETTCTC